MLAHSIIYVPFTMQETLLSSNVEGWEKTTQFKLNSIKKNNTWTFIPLPQVWKVINSKWIFKVKLNAHGDVENYKASLVARGFSQIVGIDYMELFFLLLWK